MLPYACGWPNNNWRAQGFATGDLDRDAAPARMAIARGMELFASQSYAKNLGLYGDALPPNLILLQSAVLSHQSNRRRFVQQPSALVR